MADNTNPDTPAPEQGAPAPAPEQGAQAPAPAPVVADTAAAGTGAAAAGTEAAAAGTDAKAGAVTDAKTGAGTDPSPVVADPKAGAVTDPKAGGVTDAKAAVEGEAKTEDKAKSGASSTKSGASSTKSGASSTKPSTKKPNPTQNPQRGMGGMGGMMGMMNVPMTTMSTSNVDLPYLKNKLIQELSPYNIDEDRDMVISIIRSSDYIKELKKSQHRPTIFQEGIQDFIDGIQDKILKTPETWKTEYTQAENTATLNELFHNMLKKYKDSEEEGGEMTTTDLYSLYQISNNAQNCGSSPPPPKSSDSSK